MAPPVKDIEYTIRTGKNLVFLIFDLDIDSMRDVIAAILVSSVVF